MKIFALFIGVLSTVFAMILLYSLPVYLLWNWLIPEIFGLKVITFWQALGLTTLCSFLFKSYQTSSK